jgi:hypothetical protein
MTSRRVQIYYQNQKRQSRSTRQPASIGREEATLANSTLHALASASASILHHQSSYSTAESAQGGEDGRRWSEGRGRSRDAFAGLEYGRPKDREFWDAERKIGREEEGSGRRNNDGGDRSFTLPPRRRESTALEQYRLGTDSPPQLAPTNSLYASGPLSSPYPSPRLFAPHLDSRADSLPSLHLHRTLPTTDNYLGRAPQRNYEVHDHINPLHLSPILRSPSTDATSHKTPRRC